MAGAGATDIDLARISTLKYAGMTFGAKSWAIVDVGDGCGKQLAFMDNILHAYGENGEGRVYFRAFLFTLQQLGAVFDANRIMVSTTTFQGILDQATVQLQHAQSSAVGEVISDFIPNVPVRGRWIWSLQRFDHWAAAGIFRHIHLGTADAASIKWIFR